MGRPANPTWTEEAARQPLANRRCRWSSSPATSLECVHCSVLRLWGYPGTPTQNMWGQLTPAAPKPRLLLWASGLRKVGAGEWLLQGSGGGWDSLARARLLPTGPASWAAAQKRRRRSSLPEHAWRRGKRQAGPRGSSPAAPACRQASSWKGVLLAPAAPPPQAWPLRLLPSPQPFPTSVLLNLCPGQLAEEPSSPSDTAHQQEQALLTPKPGPGLPLGPKSLDLGDTAENKAQVSALEPRKRE